MMKEPCESAHVAVGSFPYRSSRLRVIGSLEPVIFAGLVFRTMVFFNDDILIFFYYYMTSGEPATAAPTTTGSRRILIPAITPAAIERSAEDVNPNPPPRRNLTHGVLSERYHLGGRVETDTVAMAAVRQEQVEIQRRHRFERRHGIVQRTGIGTPSLRPSRRNFNIG
ncbi:hypothetical protein V8E54_011328 [Elaphomyces granulatus]